MCNLIFLDLYDNRIERISGLANLVNLRVLMLGKNRISKIENLENLVHLDVLDLHGNQVKLTGFFWSKFVIKSSICLNRFLALKI